MPITHHTYLEGAVQSLGFNLGNDDYTVGVVMPGEYNFGQAERRETIHVMLGALVINGHVYMPGEGNRCVIQSGEEIRIRADRPVVYICRYG